MGKDSSYKHMVHEKTGKHDSDKLRIYAAKDWKDYLGESLLIVFSVLLALILTEYLNNLHEKKNTRNILRNIVAELTQNKRFIQELQIYDSRVLRNIDSVLINMNAQKNLVSNGEFNLKVIAPDGVLYRYLNNEAWTIAKNNNILSKLDFETDAILTRVYDDQERMGKVEDEVAKVIFDRASRDPKQIHATLMLIRDIYHAWAVDRANGLLQEIDQAIKKVEEY